MAEPSSNGGGTPAATGLEQRERARLRARGVRVVKLAGQLAILARSRTYEPGSYFELWVGLPGEQLASLLRRYGYEITRQTGSHLRLTSTAKGGEHHIPIPRHRQLRVDTLNVILSGLAAYLEMDREELAADLFGR